MKVWTSIPQADAKTQKNFHTFLFMNETKIILWLMWDHLHLQYCISSACLRVTFLYLKKEYLTFKRSNIIYTMQYKCI